jgi:cyclopropane fatty-acyl-phospholipid synthase-like methyltransferase
MVQVLMSDTDTFDTFYDKQGFSYSEEPSPELVAFLDSNNSNGGKALDVGAGDGRNTLYLAAKGFDVTAIDASRVGIEKLQRFARERQVADRVTGIVSDAREFDYGADAWDLITSVTLFDHLEPHDVRPLFERVLAGLNERGILHVKVHTVDDPGFRGGRRPESECSKMIHYYFKRNELLSMVLPHCHVMWYSEQSEQDTSHGPLHYHGFAKLIARNLPGSDSH